MQSGTGQLRRLVIAVITALCAVISPVRADPTLTLASNTFWQSPEPWFGGFSGMEINADGSQLTLITDRGSLVTAHLVREAGTISDIRITSRMALRNKADKPWKGSFRDAEGLAIDAGGAAFMSFEGRHRVAALNLTNGITTRLPAHPDFETFENNAGLEALAIHPDGRLFALAEDPQQHKTTHPLYAYHAGTWRITHHIPKRGPFLPVGADFDAQGRLYLLERTVTPLGFRSRIRRFDLAARPALSITLLATFPAAFDNLEALSVWQDINGATRLTMISDDNFLSLQRTQIVEYFLTE